MLAAGSAITREAEVITSYADLLESAQSMPPVRPLSTSTGVLPREYLGAHPPHEYRGYQSIYEGDNHLSP